MLFQIERQLRERLVFNMKKILQAFLLLIIGCSCLTLTSCDTGNTLYVLNWAEYIDEDLIVMFEEEYNCTVVLDIAQSNEAMFSKIVPWNNQVSWRTMQNWSCTLALVTFLVSTPSISICPSLIS